MSLKALAARTIVTGIPGTSLDDDARRIVGEWKVGGIILFKRNVSTPEQTHGLIQDLRGLRKEPLLLSVDQEGGRVQRLRAPLTAFPPMRKIGESGDVEIARAVGAQLGRELRAVGFDMDYAPVVDVDTNPENPVIGDRSFARTAQDVARFGVALLEGLQSAGVFACAKHFPGHGDTKEDSHKDLPALAHSLERLRSVEWPPFAAAASAKVASIMTAHVMFPALDVTYPATLSEKCLSVLRHELAFDGVIVSDDLEMKAIADRYDVPKAAVQAIRAGCDQVLICHTPLRVEGAIEAIAAEADRDGVFRARLEYAVQKVDRLLAEVKPLPGPYQAAAAPTGKLAELIASIEMARAADPTEAVHA
jgi:beta-N-acetylhexosaminidase